MHLYVTDTEVVANIVTYLKCDFITTKSYTIYHTFFYVFLKNLIFYSFNRFPCIFFIVVYIPVKRCLFVQITTFIKMLINDGQWMTIKS